jgi:hypothetical protein
MKNILIVIVILLICLGTVLAGATGNTREDADTALPKNVIVDPSTGDKVFSNQLMIAFNNKVSSSEGKKILVNYSINVISRAPSMNIYQASFHNPDASLSKLKKTCERLKRNPKVLYVYPRKYYLNTAKTATQLRDQSLKRRGEINLSLSNNSGINKAKTINQAISQHQTALFSCIERKRRLSDDYHGSVSFRIDLSTSGKVANVRVTKTSINDRRLVQCLVNKVKKWNDFPHDKKKNRTRSVNFSFKF